MVLAVRTMTSTARRTVTHRPANMLTKGRRYSFAPRTSPYRVAPQFGQSRKNTTNGTSSRLGPAANEPKGAGVKPPFLAWKGGFTPAPFGSFEIGRAHV